AACYERVLDFKPGHAEAMSHLVAHFTEQEDWDHLVALYEDALRSRSKLEDETGALLQLGMVHWRFRNAPDEAEPYFARLRKMDPAHPGMLDFYRQFLAEDQERWVTILTDAQRGASSEEQRLQLAIELAKAAQESSSSTERAVDAWKAVLRLDPSHPEAPEALKSLYERMGKWNALVELLKGEADQVGRSQTRPAVQHLTPGLRDR
ncbi:MAG: tetratricopeptide repeat protein, partial [Nitriliruptoraceae bacterium]